MPTLTINDTQVTVPDGTTILAAAASAGVRIPSLCHMENRPAIGACRVCLVEVDGMRGLTAACSMPVSDKMKVRTATPRVREARRAVLELLLSEHDGDCQTCSRSEDCELRALCREAGVKEQHYDGERGLRLIDESTPALVRDTGKCVKCRRCVTVCTEVQGVAALQPQNRGFHTTIGPAFRGALAGAVCVQCGQCAAVCPVGAIGERDQVDEVFAALADPTKHVIVQTAPAIRAALGECFDLPPGTLVTGRMTAALRRLGFDAVFDTNFTADLTILEEGHELLGRLASALKDGGQPALPMFTSCSPGWIAYAEQLWPAILPHLSTCKSPQQMFGALAKTYYAEKIGKKPADVYCVSIMPCTAKKFEAKRPEFARDGIPDVDAVLTTRELGRMIHQAGIDFVSLPDEKMDAPFGLSSGAADIFGTTGGVMEAALRTVHEVVTGRPLSADLHLQAIAGLQGVKEASLTITGTVPAFRFLEGVTARVAVAHGLENARRLVEQLRDGASPYHFIEVMTCPGGCLGGGGQPRKTTDAIRLKRMAAIYAEDDGKQLRTSHTNTEVQALYQEWLGAPLGHRSHELLHTHYHPRHTAVP
jgi:NADP-reducing hydrogenase subunit HndD